MIAKDRFIVFESSIPQRAIIIVIVIQRPAKQVLPTKVGIKNRISLSNPRISYQAMQVMEAFDVRRIASSVLFRYLHLVRHEP